MPTQGPRSPGTGAEDTSYGTITWSNPGNILASDNSRATAALGSTQLTHYLKASNFGFTIPAGATILGILVEIERSATSSLALKDDRVRLVKGGVIQSTDKATATTYPLSDA